MKRILAFPSRERSLPSVCALFLLQAGLSQPASGQASGALHTPTPKVITNISCAPSQNGTGHMVCGAELQGTNNGPAIFNGVSWQSTPNTTPLGSPIEAPNTVNSDQIDMLLSNGESINGPFTSAPGCAAADDGTGTILCAEQGPDGGLYGVAIHPQELGTGQTAAQTSSAFMPILLPGTVLTAPGGAFEGAPCSTAHPCTIVKSLASAPSCAQSGGAMVLCAVLALEQNASGTAQTGLVGFAFDPRAAVSSSNPVVTNLTRGTFFMSDPSCTNDKDGSTTNPLNGGNTFAECAIVVAESLPWSTATIQTFSLDPRSGFSTGGPQFTSTTSFSSNPSCAAPRDGSTEVICAIGIGVGSGFLNGTSTTLQGFGVDPVAKTTTAFQSLGTPPGTNESWMGVSCASPNNPAAQNTVVCTGATNLNNVYGVLFDPRTTTAPVMSASSVFSLTNEASFNSPPSCISLNVVTNQVSCAIIDTTGESWWFFLPTP